ncbi:MAG: hypothetical protein KIT72_06170 [Polyangiaceae bacterium]|nr:hypothetical protein [Polyangiaceae bacterium]MCW5789986.1 hypothetical protein [Polyangiaceae bacterium]
MSPSAGDFQRGFMTAGYVLGRRSNALLYGLEEPLPRSESFVRVLNHPERELRAAALAPEIASLLRSVEGLGL